MRSAIVLLWLLTLTAGELRAQGQWAVVSGRKLDPRLTHQLSELARQHDAQVRTFRSSREAARSHPKLLLELRPARSLDPWARDLKQLAGSAAAGLTPELAREGYTTSAPSTGPLPPEHLIVTAADATGFHHALRRVPQLLRGSPSDPSSELGPPAKFNTIEAFGRTTVTLIADFPSFPERGIVEGFYGTPWTHAERLEMLRFEGRHGMNVYYYAPKDDPYHRRLWREPYPRQEFKRLAELVRAARENFVDFYFAISPGLSMVYSSAADFRSLTAKLASVRKLGVSRFALFLDDVPQELENPEDRAKFKTLAEAHVYLINKLDRHLKSLSKANRLVVTPTVYTNEWGSRDYVRELGAGVKPDVDIVWTGPRVVSSALTVADAKQWGELLRRPPLVWDNFPVNDGILWRPILAPLAGRDPDLPTAVRGLLSNPMVQARASLLPLSTVADYLWNSASYDPKGSFEQAVVEQYGKEAAALLAPFLEIYGNYWWDENVFRPLFVEEHRAFDTREMEQRISRLDSALEPLRGRKSFEKLVPELAPFPARTRDRLAELRADPAFRHLPDDRLEWDGSYDPLYAHRLATPPAVDGDFAKWHNGPLYELNRAAQLVAGIKQWQGPGQFSARVALGWDDDHLYVGVEVTDPKLYQPFSGRGIDKGDVVVLTLEAAFRKNFDHTQTEGDEYRLLFSPGNFAGVSPSIFSDEDYLPPRPVPRDYGREIKTVWRKTAAGFSGDICIPAAWFEGGNFRTGYEIGLSFGAQKVVEKAGGREEGPRIVFSSKSDRLFPVRLSNPSTYLRLVLTDGQK